MNQILIYIIILINIVNLLFLLPRSSKKKEKYEFSASCKIIDQFGLCVDKKIRN